MARDFTARKRVCDVQSSQPTTARVWLKCMPFIPARSTTVEPLGLQSWRSTAEFEFTSPCYWQAYSTAHMT
jgi:hypothetical protein